MWGAESGTSAIPHPEILPCKKILLLLFGNLSIPSASWEQCKGNRVGAEELAQNVHIYSRHIKNVNLQRTNDL